MNDSHEPPSDPLAHPPGRPPTGSPADEPATDRPAALGGASGIVAGDEITRGKLQGMLRRSTAVEAMVRAQAGADPDRAEPAPKGAAAKPYFLSTEEYRLACELAGTSPAPPDASEAAAREGAGSERHRAPSAEPPRSPRALGLIIVALVVLALGAAAALGLGDGPSGSSAPTAGSSSAGVRPSVAPAPPEPSGTDRATAAPAVGSRQSTTPPSSTASPTPRATLRASSPPPATRPPGPPATGSASLPPFPVQGGP